MYHYLLHLIRVEHVSSTVTARMLKDVTCEHCGMIYHYAYRAVRRKEQGQSLYGMYSDRVVEETRDAALRRASARVRSGIAPVACPQCGKLQSDMVVELRRRVVARATPSRRHLAIVLFCHGFSCVLLLTTNFLKEPITAGPGFVGRSLRSGRAAHPVGVWHRRGCPHSESRLDHRQRFLRPTAESRPSCAQEAENRRSSPPLRRSASSISRSFERQAGVRPNGPARGYFASVATSLQTKCGEIARGCDLLNPSTSSSNRFV